MSFRPVFIANDVVRMILKRGTRLVAVGLAAGLLGAAATTRLLTTMLFEIRPSDAVTYAAVVILLSLMAALATYLPARRASRVEPLVALRPE
jgi:putative ABC transport system permease protein